MPVLNTKRGFTLVEILLSIFLILAIVSILFATSGTFVSSRKSSLQGVATKIASREIENLRNTAFASLPNCPSPTGCNITVAEEPDLSKLPSSSATKTIDDYESSNKIKLVTINVNWTENAATQNIKLETLISENGL
ncbi:hypothetical protein A3I53_00960 [Candidatus Curtissbacteria bacterium RIFCSPLOWO2_02_FULL_40_13b]|uniref:Prepilin-type N-terminal cleavage/methylation domain-containing protein n=2 Tax=Candidatus Curtissiibacteriota TaxID=1752717 RepID=A0A1F5HXP9_9BACT|nr:MAG: hypothetical protein A3F45_04470 [Candidatus Curtissbacteria bacterium RIFCSPHIGHO2_12_FULL_41_17]OGE08938.1 MAG: hypothetical protein A3I53_00960 [Candidatus Curtissbacteria bacterium RIFCSPLOWO2_02_FULL_40_13b]